MSIHPFPANNNTPTPPLPPTPPPPWLLKYLSRGFRLVFYPSRQKGPAGPEGIGWLTREYTAENYPPGANVGIVLGHEIAPGRFLADVDLDWVDGTPLARSLLPATGFGFGRASRLVSHAFYTTRTPVTTRAFDNIDGKPFVELRGVKSDGQPGFQTMAPPSVHPNEEVLELRQDGDIGHVDDLPRAVTLYATACMLLAHVGHRGLLHDARLAMAGFLLQLGLTEDEVIAVGQAVAEVTGNDVVDVAAAVRSTAQKLRRSEHVNGRVALAKVIGADGRAVVSRITEWFGGTIFLLDRHDKPIRDNQENIRRGLDQLRIELSYDSFAGQILIKRDGVTAPYDDAARNRLWLEFDGRLGFRPTADYFDVVISNLARNATFHPVRDYLDSLAWDRVPRVDTWLARYGGAADNEYTRAVGALALLAAVRRVRQPGCKFDELLVLESEQGQLKSTALRALCPHDDWFTDDLPLNVDAKQVIERTRGRWLVEAAELSGLRRGEVEHLKSLLSRQVDGPVRLAYGRMSISQPRQFIVIGTTNAHNYLKDATGNRRFWPVRVQRFDVEALARDRDLIWAEASAREKASESIRLNPRLYELAELQQERRHDVDPWEPKIRAAAKTGERVRWTYDDVWNLVDTSIDRRTPEGQVRLSKILQRLGFRRIAVRRGNEIIMGWGRDPRSLLTREEEEEEPSEGGVPRA
jgi:hypothetical protein